MSTGVIQAAEAATLTTSLGPQHWIRAVVFLALAHAASDPATVAATSLTSTCIARAVATEQLMAFSRATLAVWDYHVLARTEACAEAWQALHTVLLQEGEEHEDGAPPALFPLLASSLPPALRNSGTERELCASAVANHLAAVQAQVIAMHRALDAGAEIGKSPS